MTDKALLTLCILAAGLPPVSLERDRITLAWQHSVEKTEWREDWVASKEGLIADLARIRTSGAGMEIPEHASLIDGWWVYRPTLAPLPRVILARSNATPTDWLLCQENACQPLNALVPNAPTYEPVALAPCPP